MLHLTKTKKMVGLVALCLGAMNAQANFLSLDTADFGQDTITYDTDTGLGWLDVSMTDFMTYNELMTAVGTDESLSKYRMATYEEYENMLSKMVPSVYTADYFYQNKLSRPQIVASEGYAYRDFFGNLSHQIVFGQVSNGSTLRWFASNSSTGGIVSYSDIYKYSEGYALNPDNVDIPDFTSRKSYQVRGWHLVSTGTVDLESGEFFSAADVNAPVMALGGLALFGLALRRRKIK